MTSTTTSLAATLFGVAMFGTIPAHAADVRAELTPELIYDHCLAAGVGSETEGTFMLPNGRRVSGTVLCSAEDLAATARPIRHADDDDEDDNHEVDDHDD